MKLFALVAKCLFGIVPSMECEESGIIRKANESSKYEA